MAYIGQRPVVGRYIKLDQISSGFNGSNTGFSMTAGSQAVFPGTARNLLLSLGGVIQEPDTDFTISGSTLTFTTPPAANITFFGVVYGDMQATGTPSDGTVLPASIASSGNFTFPEITISDTTPSLTFDETDSTTKYKLVEGGGTLALQISTNSGASFSNAISIGGVGNIFIPDNDKVNFGTGNDLVIVHDGSDSKITNKTGNLLIEAKDAETGIKIIPDGSIELYHNNVERISTSNTGALITGNNAADPALHIKHSNINVEGEVIRIGRIDSSARYHSIVASNSNDTASNFIKFNIHDGTNVSPFTGQLTQLFIDDDKVSLSYNGAGRFETTDDGVKVIGDVKASTGILFGSDTAAANTLDDYEEGTWTPTVLSGGTIGTPQYTCTYTKIGRLVTINADVHQLSDTTSNTNIAIGGLPYVPSGTSGNWSAVCHGERYGNDIIVAFLQYGSSGPWRITFRKGVGVSGYADLKHSDNNAATDNNLRFTLTYEIT